MYSATKAISGHGNVIGGFIVEKGGFSYDERKFPFLHRKQYIFRDENNQGRSPVDLFPYAPLGVAIRASFLAGLGGQLSPFDAYLIQNGLDTIAERLDKETANARKLVAYLKGSGHVGKVNYATDADSRMPGCCSHCSFSIRILSSDDRCEYCRPMSATPS